MMLAYADDAQSIGGNELDIDIKKISNTSFKGAEVVVVGVALAKMMEVTMVYATVIGCLTTDLEYGLYGFIALSFRRLGLIIGRETATMFIHIDGSRFVMIIGAITLAIQAIALHLAREDIVKS